MDFFSVNTCIVFEVCLGVGRCRGLTICVTYATLHRGLEHPLIWVSTVVLEQIPWIPRDNLNLGGVNIYMHVFDYTEIGAYCWLG